MEQIKIISEKKRKLIHQLFIGKVLDILGSEKTMELMEECKEALKDIE